MKHLFKALPALALAGLLGACSSTPPLQFYTLGPLAPPPAASAPASTGASLVVGPVSVPATIDRLLIVRLAGSRAEVAEHHRWAAPLKTEIARRVAGDLARRSPYARSVAWPQASIAEPTLSVPIDVQRFEDNPPGRPRHHQPPLQRHRSHRRPHLRGPRQRPRTAGGCAGGGDCGGAALKRLAGWRSLPLTPRSAPK